MSRNALRGVAGNCPTRPDDGRAKKLPPLVQQERQRGNNMDSKKPKKFEDRLDNASKQRSTESLQEVLQEIRTRLTVIEIVAGFILGTLIFLGYFR